MKELKKIIARTLCFMHQRIFRTIYIFNNYAYFSDFRAQKFPLIFFNLNPFEHQQALHFGVLNYEKQHKEGTCKVLGRSVVFSAFYADFCFCSKLVIITTLNLVLKDILTYVYLFNITRDGTILPKKKKLYILLYLKFFIFSRSKHVCQF